MPTDFELQFREIAVGDENAYGFMRSLFEFVHCFDDLFDRDKDIEADTVALCVLKLIDTLTNNSFYRQHSTALLPLLTTACFQWAASERLRKSDEFSNKVASEVLKSGYIEVFFYVALLVGGSAHSLAMDRKYRGYSFG